MGHRGCDVGQAGDVARRGGHRLETVMGQEGGLSSPVRTRRARNSARPYDRGSASVLRLPSRSPALCSMLSTSQCPLPSSTALARDLLEVYNQSVESGVRQQVWGKRRHLLLQDYLEPFASG